MLSSNPFVASSSTHPRILAVLIVCLASSAAAQSAEDGEADNDRLTLRAIFEDEAYEAEEPGKIKWLSEQGGYAMLETVTDYDEENPELDEDGDELPPPRDIVFYDPVSGDRSILASAEALTPAGQDRALTVDDYALSEDGSKLLVYANSEQVWRVKSRGDYWVLDIASGELSQLGGEDAEPSSLQFAKFSPDGSRVAYVREADIYVENLEDNGLTRLTERSTDDVINGIMSWAYEEEFSIRDGFSWSPDGSEVAYWQFDTSGVSDFYLINNTDELYPTLTEIPYPKVGETISAARVGVVPASGGDTVWAGVPGDARQTYVPRMGWAKTSDELIVQQLNRRQDRNRVYAVDADTGEVDELFTEQAVHYIESLHAVDWLENRDEFLWQSERSGWRHLYRVSRDGKTFTDLTPGDFDVIEHSATDEAGGWVYFIASPDAMEQRYLYRTRLDGSGEMEKVTPDGFAGTNGYDISDDARWAVHTHSSLDQPPQHRLISLPEHEELRILEDNQALIDKLSALSLGDHEFFRVTARDELPLDGYLMRPADFSPEKKYPLVNYVYSEVAGQTVRDVWAGKRHLWHLYLTQ